MSTRIENSFTIDASGQEVWSFLTDPERCARCLPGRSTTEKVNDSTHAVEATMKVGPISTGYKAKLTIGRLDAEAGEAEMTVTAQEVDGSGGGKISVTSKVVGLDGGGTKVTMVSAVDVTGLAAQPDRGAIQDVGEALFAQFAAAMRSQLSGASERAQSVASPAAEAESSTADEETQPLRPFRPPVAATEAPPETPAEPVSSSTDANATDATTTEPKATRIGEPPVDPASQPEPAAETEDLTIEAARQKQQESDTESRQRHTEARRLGDTDRTTEVTNEPMVRRLGSPAIWIGAAIVIALIWWMLR